VVDATHSSVDALATAVESFLLTQAVLLGVVKKSVVKTASNPNKLHKSLAPWFTEVCRAAKIAYKVAKKRFGRHSQEAKESAKAYSSTCQSARNDFSAKMPDLLKY
jgi:hypothetical protein